VNSGTASADLSDLHQFFVAHVAHHGRQLFPLGRSFSGSWVAQGVGSPTSGQTMRMLTISLLASMALLIIYVVFYFVVQYVVQD
jgi:hypothetical protein